MDQYHRAVLAAEEKFFDQCDTGSVPVVLVFTKCDALLVQGMAALTDEEKQLPQVVRVTKGQHNANILLRENPTWEKVQRMKYPPKIYVELKDLHQSDEGCKHLLEKTVVALDEEALQMLLVTTQCTNMILCIKCALQRYKKHESLTNSEQQRLVEAIGSWFPNVEVCTEYVYTV
ncbi:hypothetical protein JVU11DRAFT_1910 [Chiua virens]|nr:hypothetical protein JVU11DRAFT_1910 [Chiua virens]